MGTIKSRSIIPHSPTPHHSGYTGIDMISNLPKLVNKFLGKLPQSDYPFLSTFRFVSFWLNFALAPSLMSMIDLFSRLYYQGIKIDTFTFCQGIKREVQKFFKICYGN